MNITEAIESAIRNVVGEDGLGECTVGDYNVVAFWEGEEMVVEFEPMGWGGSTTRITKDDVDLVTGTASGK